MNNTLPSVFLAAAEQFRDRIFFYYLKDSWETMTFGEFRSLAESIAAHLGRCGLGRGDRAAIVAENRPEWCASYIAIVLCGGIAVPIDTQLGASEIGTLLADSGAKVVLYSSRTEPNVSEAVRKSAVSGINFDTWSIPPSDSPTCGGGVIPPVSPDEVASLIYTSGTTGQPKGVMLSHGNLCSDAEAVIRAKLVAEQDNVLSVLPFHHTYPFMGTFLVPLCLGVSVTFSPGLKAADIVSAIRECGVTVVLGVPRLFETIRNGIFSKIRERGAAAGILMRLISLSGYLRRTSGVNAGKALFGSVHRNFSSVRFFVSGGARLDPSVMKDLEAIGFTVIEGYGLTETSPVITFNPPDRRKPGSVGKPLPGVSLRTGEDGEIIVKGPMVMKGYYRDPPATAEVIRNGELYTGDIGYIDEDGYLFITGRKKEVIVLSSGKNIYPEDVELAYLTTPLIKEICVIGLERGGAVDAIQAVIVPDLEYARRESIGNITEVLNWKIGAASAKLPAYMRLKGYTLHPDPLPRTPLGKLRRFLVKDLVKRQEQGRRSRKQVNNTLIADDAGRRVAEAIRALMDEDSAIHAADNLELDLGFDSLKKVELLSSLESAFSVRLPDTFIAEAQTVGDIVSALKRYQGERAAAEAGVLSWKEILGKEPPVEDIRRAGYAQRPAETALVYAVLLLLKAFFRVVFRLEVRGVRNIPREGPFVIAPNHASYLDGFVIAASVPLRVFRDLYFLGLKQFFTGGLKSWFAGLSHVIPIDSETYLHKALQMSAHVLKSRRSLCIFPEGGRSFDGSVLPFKKGIGVLALELDIPVVPASVEGTFAALPRGAGFIRPAKITVTFGQPIRPAGAETGEAARGGDRYQGFADRLREEVIQLSKT